MIELSIECTWKVLLNIARIFSQQCQVVAEDEIPIITINEEEIGCFFSFPVEYQINSH